MAKRSISRSVTKIIVQILTIVVGIAFLFTCLVPYLSPEKFWWVGFAGLAAPYLITLLILLVVFWMIAKPFWALIPIVLLVIGFQQLKVVFATHYKNTFNQEKQDSSIRIVDWNVRGFNGLSDNKTAKKLVRTELAESILKLDPDIICLQEFNHSFSATATQHSKADNISLFTKTHPYYFFSKDYQTANGYASGSIIFSKYPIIDTGKLKFPKGESAIFVDVVTGNDTIRIYTTHLQSFKFKKNDYNDIDKVEGNEADALSASKNIFDKMKPAFKRRAIQARLLQQWVNKSAYPSILCGDFNDVPNSFAYFTIRADRQDAFLVKSFGIGKSFIALAPTLRIDYLLPDNQFKVQQFEMEDEGLSDHFMLVSDLHLQP